MGLHYISRAWAGTASRWRRRTHSALVPRPSERPRTPPGPPDHGAPRRPERRLWRWYPLGEEAGRETRAGLPRWNERRRKSRRREKSDGGGSVKSERGGRPIILIACRCRLGLTDASHIIVYRSERNQLCRNTEGLRDGEQTSRRAVGSLCTPPPANSRARTGQLCPATPPPAPGTGFGAGDIPRHCTAAGRNTAAMGGGG